MKESFNVLDRRHTSRGVLSWLPFSIRSLLLALSAFFWLTAPVYADEIDLTGDCPGGVGDVAALTSALDSANANGVADTLTLATNCVYTLSTPHNTVGGNNGLPVISETVTIYGNHSTLLRDASGAELRFFYVAENANLMLHELTLENGVANNGHTWPAPACPSDCGGGMYATGNITLVHTIFRNNWAEEDGGALSAVTNTVVISASDFISNSSNYGYGGAMSNDTNHLAMTDTTLISNTADLGAGLYFKTGSGDITATIHSSHLLSNTASTAGGGFYASSGWDAATYRLTLTFTDGVISYNRADSGAGLNLSADNNDNFFVTLNDSYIQHNVAERGAGGGIYYHGYGAQNVYLTLNRSHISYNRAEEKWGSGGSGGGISSAPFVDSSVTAAHLMRCNACTIQHNRAVNLGGGLHISEGQVFLSDSTISHNNAGGGGGLSAYSSPMIVLPAQFFINNSTISDNAANWSGGGILSRADLHLAHVTIAGNTADSYGSNFGDGGGLYQDMGTVILTNTLLAGNHDLSPMTSTTIYPDCAYADISPTPGSRVMTSDGYNLVGNTTGCTNTFTAPSDVTGVLPALGPLQDNGGWTWTHALLVGSPAVDRIPNGVNGCGLTFNSDQRGAVRPFGSACDIGAYEGALSSVQFSATEYSVREQDAHATIILTLTPANPSASTYVTYTSQDHTATAGADYTAVTGLSTFLPGVTSTTFTVPILDDTLSEPTETVTLSLSLPSGAALGVPVTASLNILDNDVLHLSLSDASVPEGDSGTTAMVFTATLSGPSSLPISVDYATADGTATAGVDYTALPTRTLTFAPGVTQKTFTVTVMGDTLDEMNETVFVSLANSVGAILDDPQGSGTIVDDDDPIVSYRRSVYLPLILHLYQKAPDLTIRSLTVAPSTPLLVGELATITIVIENIGDVPATGAFWLDLYIDPDPALMPPQVNQTWDMVGSQYGLSWWITQTLAVGEQLTLTSLSYAADYSYWPGTFNCFGPHQLYAQVDSYNSSGAASGAIVELDETNNIAGPLSVPVICPTNSVLACPELRRWYSGSVLPRP